MWIVFESLKNAYDILVLSLPSWLGRVLAFEDHEAPDDLEAFWILMGLEPQWVQLLVVLQLRFR